MMNEQEIKRIFASRLAFFRKSAGLTQSQLAEMLNYSDKAVSKWERGEGMPDVYVMSKIAGLFGVCVDDLINEQKPERPVSREYNHRLIAIVSMGLVWVVAAVAFSILSFIGVKNFAPWLCFIYAMPLSFIVWIVFSSIWWGKKMLTVTISGFLWTVFLSFSMTIGFYKFLWFLVPVALLQVLIILFFSIRFRRNKK